MPANGNKRLPQTHLVVKLLFLHVLGADLFTFFPSERQAAGDKLVSNDAC